MHVTVVQRIHSAHGKRVARQESIYGWFAGWNLAARQTLDPCLSPQELQQQARRRGAPRVDAVYIHDRVSGGQGGRVVDQYERGIVRLNRSLRDRRFRKPIREQITQ